MSPSRTTKGKIESTQSEKPNCSSDLSCIRADNKLMELLWENGQIAMQDQSNRPRKSSFFPALPSHISRVREKETEDVIIPKLDKFKGIESMANDFSPYTPSASTGLHAQDDDMVSWINSPIEDSLHDNYCQEFLNEFLEVNHSSLCGHSNAAPSNRSNGFGQMPRDSDDVEDSLDLKVFARDSEPSRIRTSQLFQLSQQCRSAVPSTKSGATSIGVNRTSKTHPGLTEALLNTRFPKQDVASSNPTSSGVGVMNFSQFGRPAAIAKASLLNVDGLRSSEKAFTSAGSNPMQSTVIESTSGLSSVCAIREQMPSVEAKVEFRPSAKPLNEVISIEWSEAICQENPNNKNTCDHNSSHEHIQSSGFTASGTIGGHEIRKGPEAIVASSSVCSVNSSEAVANDPIHREKRKNREEESEYQSEDIEEDSMRLKKTTSGRDLKAKRSRATEVHNLSERRRRDRINEKMRALQELIPHCNKVDKASMLDEAIEYLKTLRMQVQMMSMGSGLCMPPMAMPAGMQQMRTHPMAHFWPMCVGMGMGNGLGYGMGMYDINGVARFPLVPFPPVHEPQFSFPSIPGAPGLHGMPGSTSLQMFGGIPGQGLPPVWVPPLPPLSSSSGLSVTGYSMPEVSGITTSPVPTADTVPSSSLKDQQHQNLNLDTAQKKDIYSVKECFKQSSLVRTIDQTLRDRGIEALNSITGYD